MIMMIILIIISILLFLFFLFIVQDDDLATISVIGFVIKMAIVIILLVKLVDIRVIDKKIKLYRNQNKEIEEKIELVVKEYMNFEKDTYKDLKSDSYIQLVNLYPDLKSDKMVQQQINLYTKNNKKITNLKEQKINERIYKWWLYFGK